MRAGDGWRVRQAQTLLGRRRGSDPREASGDPEWNLGGDNRARPDRSHHQHRDSGDS